MTFQRFKPNKAYFKNAKKMKKKWASYRKAKRKTATVQYLRNPSARDFISATSRVPVHDRQEALRLRTSKEAEHLLNDKHLRLIKELTSQRVPVVVLKKRVPAVMPKSVPSVRFGASTGQVRGKPVGRRSVPPPYLPASVRT